MDYLIKTKPRQWELKERYPHYRQSCETFEAAKVKLKLDLNDLLQSELSSDKAKKSFQALLKDIDVKYALNLRPF